MKAERDIASTHVEAHFYRGWRTRGLSKSTELIIREGSLPSSLANRYFDCQKTKGAGFNFPGKLPAPSILVEFAFEIWERESAPAELMPDTAIYGPYLSESAAKFIGCR